MTAATTKSIQPSTMSRLFDNTAWASANVELDVFDSLTSFILRTSVHSQTQFTGVRMLLFRSWWLNFTDSLRIQSHSLAPRFIVTLSESYFIIFLKLLFCSFWTSPRFFANPIFFLEKIQGLTSKIYLIIWEWSSYFKKWLDKSRNDEINPGWDKPRNDEINPEIYLIMR